MWCSFFGLEEQKINLSFLRPWSASFSSTSLSWQVFTTASDSQSLLINRMIEIWFKTTFVGSSRRWIRWNINSPTELLLEKGTSNCRAPITGWNSSRFGCRLCTNGKTTRKIYFWLPGLKILFMVAWPHHNSKGIWWWWDIDLLVYQKQRKNPGDSIERNIFQGHTLRKPFPPSRPHLLSIILSCYEPIQGLVYSIGQSLHDLIVLWKHHKRLTQRNALLILIQSRW